MKAAFYLFTLWALMLCVACQKDDTSSTPNPVVARNRMVGNYTVKSNPCTFVPLKTGDSFIIRAGIAPDELDIDNVFNATVSGNNFSIPKTTTSSGVVTGTGTLSGKLLLMTLVVEATATVPSTSCTVEFLKQ